MSNQPTKSMPSHHVYRVSDREESEKAIWTQIGAAWPHGDGKGFNIQLSAFPISGKMTIRERTSEAAQS